MADLLGVPEGVVGGLNPPANEPRGSALSSQAAPSETPQNDVDPAQTGPTRNHPSDRTGKPIG